MAAPIVVLESKSSKQVKELLREWLEADDIEEVILLAKRKGKGYRWDHSGMTSVFWWMGLLTHISAILSDYQEEE